MSMLMFRFLCRYLTNRWRSSTWQQTIYQNKLIAPYGNTPFAICFHPTMVSTREWIPIQA